MSRGSKKQYRYNEMSTVKCATEGCKHKIKMRLVVEAAARGDKTPLKCYRCSHPKRKQNKVANKLKRMSQGNTKSMTADQQE